MVFSYCVIAVTEQTRPCVTEELWRHLNSGLEKPLPTQSFSGCCLCRSSEDRNICNIGDAGLACEVSEESLKVPKRLNQGHSIWGIKNLASVGLKKKSVMIGQSSAPKQWNLCFPGTIDAGWLKLRNQQWLRRYQHHRGLKIWQYFLRISFLSRRVKTISHACSWTTQVVLEARRCHREQLRLGTMWHGWSYWKGARLLKAQPNCNGKVQHFGDASAMQQLSSTAGSVQWRGLSLWNKLYVL